MFLNFPRVSTLCAVILALLNTIVVIGGRKSQEASRRLQTGGEPQGRILNGDEAKQDEWRFMVSIGRMINGTYEKFCGGSIWNEEFILTAAHCLVAPNPGQTLDQLAIIIAQADLSMLNETNMFFAKSYTIHQEYSVVTKVHDIAVIRLKEKIDFEGKNSNARCICNPERVIAGQTTSVDLRECVTAGWGNTYAPFQGLGPGKPDKLQQVFLKIMDEEFCRKGSESKHYNPQSHLCTFLKDLRGWVVYGPCNGDSGGPILCRHVDHSEVYILVGITAHVEKKCIGHAYYTHVWNHMQWIMMVTGETDNETPSGSTFRRLFTGFTIFGAIVGVGGIIGVTLAHLEERKDEIDPEISSPTLKATVKN